MFLFTVLFVCASKRYLHHVSPISTSSFGAKSAPHKNPSVYFVGTSRVNPGVDTDELEKHIKGYNIHNLGVAGGTLLSSLAITEYYLQNQKGPKTFFIEITPLSDEVPSEYLSFSPHMKKELLPSLNRLTNQHSLSRRFQLLSRISNDLIFNSTSLRFDINRILHPKVEEKKKTQVLLNKIVESKNLTGKSLLTKNDFTTCYFKKSELGNYLQMINRLNQIAVNNQARIFFFLPVAFRTEAERHVATSIYHHLPIDCRLEYTDTFLHKVAIKDHLSDINHLNDLGVKIYTKQLALLLEDYLK